VKPVQTDIVYMHNSLLNHLKLHTKQLEDILNTTSAILTGNDKLKEVAETANTDIKEVISKVSKVTVTVDKIVSDSKMYHDALLVSQPRPTKRGDRPENPQRSRAKGQTDPRGFDTVQMALRVGHRDTSSSPRRSYPR